MNDGREAAYTITPLLSCQIECGLDNDLQMDTCNLPFSMHFPGRHCAKPDARRSLFSIDNTDRDNWN